MLAAIAWSCDIFQTLLKRPVEHESLEDEILLSLHIGSNLELFRVKNEVKRFEDEETL